MPKRSRVVDPCEARINIAPSIRSILADRLDAMAARLGLSADQALALSRGVLPEEFAEPNLPQPTRAKVGTLDKVNEMIVRAASGLSLFHPLDAAGMAFGRRYALVHELRGCHTYQQALRRAKKLLRWGRLDPPLPNGNSISQLPIMDGEIA